MILQTIFLFFARYPDHNGVMKNFNKASSTAAYTTLKQSASGLTIKDIFPEITDYVFGVSDNAVKKRIQTISGLYLFVDYGNIRTSKNQLNVRQDNFDLSVTLARPFSSNQFDSIEEVIMVDRYLELIKLIRDDMYSNKADPFVQMLTMPTEIIPFASAELNNSFGFSMVFQMQGIDMI